MILTLSSIIPSGTLRTRLQWTISLMSIFLIAGKPGFGEQSDYLSSALLLAASDYQESDNRGMEVPATETQANADHPQVLFNRGNYMLEEHDYYHALQTFRAIEKNGYASGPLFYNIGISYIYLDSLGMASYYFHKSAHYSDTGNRAHAGISFIEEQMRNRGTYIPGLPWYVLVDRILFETNHSGWVKRGLVLFNIGVLLLLIGWKYRPERYFLMGAMAVVFAGIFIIAAGTSLYLWSNNHNQAIVVELRVPLQPDPDSVTADMNIVDHNIEDMEVDLAYEGYTVTLNRRISRDHPGRVYVRLRNGVSGWVPESSLRIL